MADADFWRDLSAQFRALPDDDGDFAIEWRVHAGEKEVRWKPFGTADTWGQFKVLAAFAGSALNPEVGNFETWLSLLKDAIPGRNTRSVRRYNSDETTLNFTEGFIPHPCAASALRCRVLEAKARGYKTGSIDTRSLFSAEAIKRIDRAKRKADEFTLEAQASIDRNGINPAGRKAKKKEHAGRLKSAEFIVRALHVEYSRLGLSDCEYEICINGEIESLWYLLKLHNSERLLLESKYSTQAELHVEQPAKPALTEKKIDDSPLLTVSQFEQLYSQMDFDCDTLAGLVRLHVRNVYRHRFGYAEPRPKNIRAYEKVFSKALNRQITLDSNSFKWPPLE